MEKWFYIVRRGIDLLLDYIGDRYEELGFDHLTNDNMYLFAVVDSYPVFNRYGVRYLGILLKHIEDLGASQLGLLVHLFSELRTLGFNAELVFADLWWEKALVMMYGDPRSELWLVERLVNDPESVVYPSGLVTSLERLVSKLLMAVYRCGQR